MAGNCVRLFTLREFLSHNRHVKDFVSSHTQKKHSSLGRNAFQKKEWSQKWAPFLFTAAVVLLIFFGLGAVIRSLQLGDFIRQAPSQNMLVLFREVGASSAYLVKADFSALQLQIYPIETEQEQEVSGYGKYRLQAVYPLFALEKKPLHFVRSSLSFSLGTILDGVWPVYSTLSQWQSRTDFQRLFFSREIQTLPLSWKEKWNWFALASDTRTETIFHDTITQLPLNSGVVGTPKEALSCSLALVNTTSTYGLAGKIDGLLSSNGFSVIRTTSDQQEIGQTTITVNETSDNECQWVIQKVKKLLPDSVLSIKDEAQTQEYRADIVVKLGKDMAQ